MRAAIIGLMIGWAALTGAADAVNGPAYGKHLHALAEESLCCDAAAQGRVVRFLWLRSFQHPVVIRLDELPNGNWRVLTKIGSGAGGYEPGATFTQETRTVTAAQARAAISIFGAASDFWNTASVEPATPAKDCPPRPGLACVAIRADGAQWIVEARDGTRYHYVDRWSPASGATRAMGEQFMALSGQDFGKIY